MIRACRLTLLIGAAIAAPAVAQDALRQRTGPQASGPLLPDYAVPPAPPPATPAPAIAETKPDAAPIIFSDIIVDANRIAVARPHRGWQGDPAADGQPALSPPGAQGFDADWVRRQFIDRRLIGEPVSLDRVVALIEAINLAFVQNGFINSGVQLADPRGADGGVLHVRLVYGRLASDAGAPVTVQWGAHGAKGLSADYIRHRMRSTQQVPIDAGAIERDFRRLTEDAAIASVTADLRPGTVPGEAVLALTVDPVARGDAYIAVGNSRSPAIGGERGAIGGSLRNIALAGDVLSAEAGLTVGRPDFAGAYSTPFFAPAITATLRGNYSDAAVVDRPLLPLDIQAREWSIEAGLSYRPLGAPLTPAGAGKWRAARSLAIGFRLIHRQTRAYLLGMPFSFSPGSVSGRAEYSALRLTADWIERGTRHVTALSATATQGLEGTRSDIADIARPSPSFRVFQLDFSHAYRIDDHGLELRARGYGQIADGILYSAERLSAGGAYTVRGYRETLTLADSGVIGSLELARRFSLTGGRAGRGGFDPGAFSASIFADTAILRNEAEPAPGNDWLASVGVGLGWVPSNALMAKMSYGYAIIPAQQIASRDLQDRGISFSATLHPLLLLARRR